MTVLDPSVHIHDEVGVCCKESHLTLRIATIGAMGVGLDEFPNREAIRGFVGRDADVLTHRKVSLGFEGGPGFERRLVDLDRQIRRTAGNISVLELD